MATPISKLVLSILALAALVAPEMARADDLKSFTLPQGGQAVYGPLTGHDGLADGMTFMLKQVHGHYDDRPVVGKVFRVRGSASVATFFSLTDKRYTHKPLSGMIIVFQGKSGALSAAVLTDAPGHFNQSVDPMLKRVSQAMAAEAPMSARGGASKAGASLAAAPAAPLRRAVFPDNSGSIGLPQGWQIRGAMGGAVNAEGSDGGSITMGQYVPVMDTRSPQQMQMIQMETQGGRVPLPGMYTAYPYGGDPLQAFVAIQNQLRQKNRSAPILVLKVISRNPRPQGFIARAIVDLQDGHGPSDTIIAVDFVQSGNGLYGMISDILATPQAMSARDMPTLIAMAESYRTNQSQINAEVNSTIQQIHAVGDASRAQADIAHAQEDSIIARGEAIDDANARAGAGFSDYMRDESVVGVAGTNAHIRTDNATAEGLVAGNPSRFEYVPQSQYIQGQDY